MSIGRKTVGGPVLGAISFWIPATALAYSSDTVESIIGFTGGVVFVGLIFVLCYYILRYKQKRVLRKIELFQTKDPGFGMEKFQRFVYALYYRIISARQTQDMRPLASYLAPAALGPFESEVERHIRDNTFLKVDEASLDKAWIQDVRADDRFDVIDIWVGGKAKTYVVGEQGQVVSGSAGKFKDWDEKWTLIRPLGVLTPKEGDCRPCPNCSSPVGLGSLVCPACSGVIPNSGEQWVLAAIGPIQQLSDNYVYYDFGQN